MASFVVLLLQIKDRLYNAWFSGRKNDTDWKFGMI